MARGGNRSLVLDIAANATKLDAGVKAARSTLAQLKGDFTNLEAVADEAFSNLGGDGAARSARQAEAEFNRMFRTISANAKAIKAETSQDFALKMFDVGAADEQVRALTQQAGFLREVSARAKEASLAGGEFAAKQGEIATSTYLAAKELEQQALELDQAASAWRELGPTASRTAAITAQSTEINAQHRAGLQQLGYQLGDVATMYSLGAKPAQIFGSQIGQITQAVQLMSGGTSKLAAFLGGPWGIALSVATIVLAPFVGKLWESEEAMEAVELAGDGMSSAQSALAQIFDTTTGAIKNQNAQLRLNAQLLAINLRAEAAAAKTTAADGAKDAGQMSWGAIWRGNVPLRKAFETRNTVGRAKLQGILNAGSADEASKLAMSAAKWAETANFSNVDISREDFINAVARAAEVRAKQDTADKIESSLARNSLDQSFRTEPKGRSGKTDHSAERAAQEALDRARALEDAQAQADQSILGALLKRAQTEDQRLAIQLMQMAAETKSRDLAFERQVADQVAAGVDRKKAEADAAALKAKWAVVEQLEKEALQGEARQRKLDEQLQAEQEELGDKVSILRLQGQFAETLEQRRRVALQILGYELEERRNAARRLLASNNAADRAAGQRQLDQIDVEAPLLRQQLDRDFADPVERYLQHLRDAADDTNDALNRVRADGLADLEDGLVAVITGTESVGGAFKKMANQIISDLVRIGVQRAILGGIDGARGGGGLLGAVLGIFSGGGGASQALNPFGGIYADGGLVTGPGSGTSDSIVARVSNGEFVVNAASTARFLPLLEAINSGAPGFADGGLVSVPRLPVAASLRGGASGPGNVTIPITINAPGATAETVAMIRRELANAAPALVQAATANTVRQITRSKI